MLALPEEIKVLLTFLVTQGVKSLAKLFGKDINGGGAAVVAVLVGAIVFFIEGVIALFPEHEELAEIILSLLAVVLGSFGTHYTYKNIAK